MINKKILIAIPTYNRPIIVDYLLTMISDTINTTTNIFLKFYDSSTDNMTESIVESYLNDKIGYKRYEPGLGEEKGLDILIHDGPCYDYIWFCSDRKVLNLNLLLPTIEKDINNGEDFIFFANNGSGGRRVINSREEIGLSFILLETDAPYLTPVPYRGKQNSSKYIPYIGKKISEILNISEEKAAKITTENACSLFDLK